MRVLKTNHTIFHAAFGVSSTSTDIQIRLTEWQWVDGKSYRIQWRCFWIFHGKHGWWWGTEGGKIWICGFQELGSYTVVQDSTLVLSTSIMDQAFKSRIGNGRNLNIWFVVMSKIYPLAWYLIFSIQTWAAWNHISTVFLKNWYNVDTKFVYLRRSLSVDSLGEDSNLVILNVEGRKLALSRSRFDNDSWMLPLYHHVLSRL